MALFHFLLWSACSAPSPYEAWCDAAADCDPGASVDACITALEEEERLAEADGCGAVFAQWGACMEEEAVCVDGAFGDGVCLLEADDLLECRRAAAFPSVDPDVHEYCVLSDSCHDADHPEGAYGACVEREGRASVDANALGCGLSYQLWIRCMVSAGTCANGVPVAASCDERLADFMACVTES